jgi:hypothetical protein
MPDMGTAAVAGANVVSGAMGSRASRKSAETQERATMADIDLRREIFQKQTELQEPFRQSGIAAQNELLRLLGIGDAGRDASDYGLLTRQYGMDQFQQDPGYAFRFREGLKGVDRSAAARGGLLSGATLKATQRFGQDLASQEFTNAFNRYQAQLGTRLGTLGSMYGGGQAGTAQLVGAAGQMGEGISNALMGGANARASGYVGQANAFNQALGQGINFYQQQQLLNRLTPPPASDGLNYYTPQYSRRVGTAPGG